MMTDHTNDCELTTMAHDQLIEQFQAQVQPITTEDTMAEAGRKALLVDFITMLQHEAGSRTGDDTEEVHDMRDATRRMRSTLRLLDAYYKPKSIRPFLKELRKLAGALGAVRDLDVLIDNVKAFQATTEQPADVQPLIDQLDQERAQARTSLIKRFDKGSYGEFVDDFAAFLAKPGKGALAVDEDEIHPYQVRELLPILLYQHLAAVRAYERVLPDADDATLHALRIEFKRLRYAVTVFSAVLGTTIADYIDELKAIQDHLGKIADIRTASEHLNDLASRFNPQTHADILYALQLYIDHMQEDRTQLRAGVDDLWKHFNTKTVQRQLATAIVGL